MLQHLTKFETLKKKKEALEEEWQKISLEKMNGLKSDVLNKFHNYFRTRNLPFKVEDFNNNDTRTAKYEDHTITMAASFQNYGIIIFEISCHLKLGETKPITRRFSLIPNRKCQLKTKDFVPANASDTTQAIILQINDLHQTIHELEGKIKDFESLEWIISVEDNNNRSYTDIYAVFDYLFLSN